MRRKYLNKETKNKRKATEKYMEEKSKVKKLEGGTKAL